MARAKPRDRKRPERVELGGYWLDFRSDRGEWTICWYDAAARTRRRRSTGICGGSADEPPEEARTALAHWVLKQAQLETAELIVQPLPQTTSGAPAQCELDAGPAKPAAPVPAPAPAPVQMAPPVLKSTFPRPPLVSVGAMVPDRPLAHAEALVADIFARWQAEHVATLEDPGRYAVSVQHWLDFFVEQRRLGELGVEVTVADIRKVLVDRFIDWREGQGAGGHTISRDLAAMRGALNHEFRQERLVAPPYVRDVDLKSKAKPRELVYTPEQVAAIMEAAHARPDRHHVLLYILIQLSTCGRSEAILDLHGHQIIDERIHFLSADRRQTSKRRSIVPVAPTLAPWLAGIRGKVIVYRAPIAEHRRKPGGPAYFEKPCYDIGNAFDGCLREAGLSRQVYDLQGVPVMLPVRRKLGETERRPKLAGIGSPNTLRHTIITEMHRRGVPEAQIETASGHAGEGTNKRNYRHLRPDYLAGLVDGVEAFWADIDAFTDVHRRIP